MINISISNRKLIGIFPVLLFVFTLALLSGYILYQIFPKNNFNSLFPIKQNSRVIYIIKSNDTINYYLNRDIDFNIYLDKLNSFKLKLKEANFNVKTINTQSLPNIPKHSIVFCMDSFNITDKNYETIYKFIKNGGTFIFNYHFGYFNNDKFIGPERITKITNLKFLSEGIAKNHTAFFVPHLLSPFVKSDINSKREDLVLYANDSLPLYKSDYIPDFTISNWEITATAKFQNKLLKVNEAGIGWHGFLGKGKWIYFSTPLYVFLDMRKELFDKIINNIYNYSANPITIATYPYIDTKKAIFISEDTEYKYENMIHFSKLAKQYNIHTTLFCVAKLAEQHKEITKEASNFPNIEIASHSYSHTKIMGASDEKVKKEILYSKEVLEEITGKKIYGFRPPREEIDKSMENWLRKAGYVYVMEKVKPFLLPKEVYDNLITIPRHGTDDYLYVINLDWTNDQILSKIIQETTTLTNLNILYTLSVHTHLLSYKTNLYILKNYFEFLKKHLDIKPLKGIELAKRAKLLPNISYSYETIGNTIFLKIYNRNNSDIKNLSFRIFWPNIKIKSITSEYVGVKISKISSNKKRRFTDYKINKIKANSTLSLIITYEKI